MTLTPQEANKIKEHLLKQLTNFPEDKREQIEEQVNSMTPQEIENFVDENKLTHLGSCIFCSIVKGKTPSIIIDENQDNIAILEIKPLSKGHTLIVPKEHLQKILPTTKILAEKIGHLLKDKLNPNEIKVNEINIMGHQILEVIPLFGDETERYEATEEGLKKVYEKLKGEIKQEKDKKPKEKEPEEKLTIPKLPPRIPN